jgi:hypothetical protein
MVCRQRTTTTFLYSILTATKWCGRAEEPDGGGDDEESTQGKKGAG